MQCVILEVRTTRRHEWEPLVPEAGCPFGMLFTPAEADEFFAGLDRDDDGLYRRRLLPEFGHDTRVFYWAPVGGWRDEPAPPLARDMPASVHALNDAVLTAFGL